MKKFSEQDKKYMKLAINLAEKARGETAPNPMVGAVIVKDSHIISTGYHKKAGKPHAEIEAIKKCRESLTGSKMYITLEPCSTYGRTPPCTTELKKHNFSEIIIGSQDPNPKAFGRGIKILRDHDFKVKVGLLAPRIRKQNEAFFKNMERAIPFVTAKIASSIDGKLAAKTGDSKWITSTESRKTVQKLRAEAGCTLTGINTVISDNPYLFPRKKLDDYSVEKRLENFTRVILDSSLRIALDSNIVKTSNKVNTIIFSSSNNRKKEDRLKSNNIKVVKINLKASGSLLKILKILYHEFSIHSILVESGPTLLTSLLEANLIDRLVIFLAPIIIGADSGYDMFGDLGIKHIKEAKKLVFEKAAEQGKDIMAIAYPK